MNNSKIINVPGIGKDGKYTDPREIKALEKFLKAEEEGWGVREETIDLKKQEKLPREGKIDSGNKNVKVSIPENQVLNNPSTGNNLKLNTSNGSDIEESEKISKIELKIPEQRKGGLKLEYLGETDDVLEGTIGKEKLKVDSSINEEKILINIPTSINNNDTPNTETKRLEITTTPEGIKQIIKKLSVDSSNLNPTTDILKIKIDEKELKTEKVHLDVDEKELEIKKVGLIVDEKELETSKINLEVDEKELETGKVGLIVDEKELETKKVHLDVDEKELEIKKVGLIVDEKELETSKINLEVDEKELEIKKIGLTVDEKELEIRKVNLEVDEKTGSISKIQLEDIRRENPNLSYYNIPTNTQKEPSLDDVLDIIDIEDLSKLPEENKKLNIPNGNRRTVDPQLDIKTIKDNSNSFDNEFFKYQLPEDNYTSSGNYEHTYFNPKDLTEPPYDSVLSIPDDTNSPTSPKINVDILPEDSESEKEHNYISQSDQKKLEEYKYNTALKLATELSGMKVEVAEKISTAISSYLSSPTPTISDVEGYESRMNNIKMIMNQSLKTRYKVSDYKLPEFDIDYSLNPSNYLRYLAEKSLPIKSSNPNTLVNLSTVRETLLDEALNLLLKTRDFLERETKVNRDRLPGGATSALAEDIAQNGLSLSTVSSAISAVVSPAPEVRFPINRPPEDGKTVGWEDGNKYVLGAGNTDDSSYKERLKNYVVGSSGKIDYKFEDRYLKGKGIDLTLSELCGHKASEIKSVEDLKKILSESPYYTTSKKFTTTKSGEFNIMTLDSNSYWEIILQPYVGSLNNNFSFLPDFREINLINQKMSGVITGYNKWVPISGFELMKSKLSSKSINLFDGEINIPTSIEFTNELRLTIVDDMFKSWKLYFEKCLEVYVYNSESHSKDYYLNPSEEDLKHITAVDKSSVCISPYKNVTFVCDIYIMTPQSETIKKFSLLVVLKDLSEEFVGDIDSGGTDLSVSFSIVGENPPDITSEREKSLKNQQEGGNSYSNNIEKKADKASSPSSSSNSVKIFS